MIKPTLGLKVFGKLESSVQSTACAFTADGSLSLFCTSDGRLIAKSVKKDLIVTQIKVCQTSYPVLNVKALQKQKDHRLFFSNADGTINQFRLTKSSIKKHCQIKLQDDDYAKAMDVDERIIAAGLSNSKILTIDQQTKTIKSTLQSIHYGATGHTNRIFCLKLTPQDPNLLVSGGWDTAIRIWDLRTGRSELGILGTFVCGQSLDIRQGQLLVGNLRQENQLQLYDLRTQKLLRQLAYVPGECVNSCCFDFYKKGIVFAAGDKSLSVVGLNTQQQLLNKMQLSSASNFIASSCKGQLSIGLKAGGILARIQLKGSQKIIE